MKVTSKFERLYYGMRVYSLTNEDGQTVELPAGLELTADSITTLLGDSEWGSVEDRALVEAFLLDLVIDAKIREIDAYDTSSAVNGFILDGELAWLDRNTRGGLGRRLASEKREGREISTLWLGTRNFPLPIPLAKSLLDIVEVYAADCFDVTAQHKATVLAMTDVDAVRAYDHTSGYPPRPVISTQG